MDDNSKTRDTLIVQAAGLVAVLCAYMATITTRARIRNYRAPVRYVMFERDIARLSNLRFIYDTNDINCHDLLRMNRAPFYNLCTLFRERKLLEDSIHTSIEEQLAMFLLVAGHNHRFRAMKPIFRRSIEVISRYFKAVLYAIGELRDEMIQPPSNEVHPKILHSRRFYPYFKVICYHLAHDALILADALERNDGFVVPAGKFYLVDAGYAVRPGFLPPYRATRYHLTEFGARVPQNEKELFNLRHSSLRITVERAFAAFKNRWRIVDNKPHHPYPSQVKIVLACCILHNWILQWGEDEFVLPEHTWTGNPASDGVIDIENDNRTFLFCDFKAEKSSRPIPLGSCILLKQDSLDKHNSSEPIYQSSNITCGRHSRLFDGIDKHYIILKNATNQGMPV